VAIDVIDENMKMSLSGAARLGDAHSGKRQA